MKSLSLTSFATRWTALLLLAALAACGGAGIDSQLPKVFSATLTGAEETPPVNSPGKGVGALVFHPEDRSFTATVVTSGITETVAHIHEGPPGVAGPIIFPLTKDPGGVQWKATGTLTPDQEAKLKAGNYYFNVHSPTNPNGEIRGQITERALTPQQQQQLQQRLQQAGTQLQQVSAQVQQAGANAQVAQAGQQQAQAVQQQAQQAQQQLQQAAQQAQQRAQQAAQQAQQAGAAGAAGTTVGGTPGMTGTGTAGGY